MCFIEDLIL